MSREAFVEGGRTRWQELDGLLRRAGRHAAKLGPRGVRRLGELYRAAVADLALARRRYPGDPLVGQLDALVRRARPLVYDADRRAESFGRFLSTGMWRRIAERPAYLLVAAALLFGSWTLAGVWAWRDPVAAEPVVPGQFQQWGQELGDRPTPTAEESAAFSSQLFTNNIRVALVSFAGGIAAGLGTALSLLFNGVVLGAVTGVAIRAGNGDLLVEWLPAHGVLEISCLVVAAAAGLRMGWSLVAPGYRPRSVALAEEARAAVEMVLGAALWLVVAGLLEGFVSPSDVGLAARIAVGLVAGGAFWGLVWWRGHEPKDHEPKDHARPEVRAALAPSP